jgi:hypothetical protein
MGKNVTLVGGNGDGQTTKVANQIIVALTIEAVGEALLFASKAGADPARVREALMGGFASSRILEVHGKRMIERKFEPGFRIALHQKDLNLALQGARRRRGRARTRAQSREPARRIRQAPASPIAERPPRRPRIAPAPRRSSPHHAVRLHPRRPRNPHRPRPRRSRVPVTWRSRSLLTRSVPPLERLLPAFPPGRLRCLAPFPGPQFQRPRHAVRVAAPWGPARRS